jgi:hypothetical protein
MPAFGPTTTAIAPGPIRAFLGRAPAAPSRCLFATGIPDTTASGSGGNGCALSEMVEAGTFRSGD